MQKLKIAKMSTNGGITLIALVITIIVLLILAGISIATLTGDNGLINKTNLAKIEAEKAAAREKVEVEVLGSYNKLGKLDEDILNRNLKNIEGITGTPIVGFPATVNVDGYNISIDKYGNVTLEGDIVLDDEQFELGTEEDLKNKADEVIEGSSTSEDWVKAIDIYGNEVNMEYWYYESNGDGTFDLNTTSNIESGVAGYKGSIESNTIVGEIPAYIIKCTNGVIEEGKVISLEGAFSNLTNLTNLREDLKIPPEVNNLIGILQGTGITEIPNALCNMGSNVNYANMMFKNCTQLREIAPEFTLGENVWEATYLFESTSITTIPDTFKLSDIMWNIEGMFYRSKLAEIPESFEITSYVSNANALFYGTKITEVPATFVIPENVYYVALMFSGCEELETISPEFKLPKYVDDVSGMFLGCKKLRAIPDDFELPNTVKRARYMFQVCEMLSEIPANFIIPNSVEDCSYMFATCWRMETIRDGFKIGTGVTNAEGMFYQCGNLKEINITVPANVENMNKMFCQGTSNKVTGNITLEGIPTQYDQAFYNMGISNSENLINVYVKNNTLLEALEATVGTGKVNFYVNT